MQTDERTLLSSLQHSEEEIRYFSSHENNGHLGHKPNGYK
jgi:hypothetical protein